MACARGKSLSSAILYLAIVAIWAVCLVPRWVRRPHWVPEAAESPAESADEIAATDDVMTDSYSAPDYPAPDYSAPADAPPWPGRGRLDSWRGIRDRVQAAVQARATARAAASRPPVVRPPATQPPATRPPATQPPAAWPTADRPTADRPRIGRSRILQARRRLLTMLVTLAVIAAFCTSTRITPWWACVPPAGMLGLYILLLREAALADADQTRWRAEEADYQARAARQAASEEQAREAERAAREAERAARVPEPSAQIIDISGRLGDQLYDQYADATARAIGD